jgi:hypothetical protein
LQDKIREKSREIEEWEIEECSPQEDPEEEFDWPVSLLGKEIPGGVNEG